LKSVNEIKAPEAPEKEFLEGKNQTKTDVSTHRDTSVIVVACDRADYSASRIARAVEDCDVHVLSLVMAPDTIGYDTVTVDLRVDTPAAANVVRSIERYGYEVTFVDTPEAYDDPTLDTARFRALEVLRLIDV